MCFESKLFAHGHSISLCTKDKISNNNNNFFVGILPRKRVTNLELLSNEFIIKKMYGFLLCLKRLKTAGTSRAAELQTTVFCQAIKIWPQIAQYKLHRRSSINNPTINYRYLFSIYGAVMNVNFTAWE